MYTIVNLSAAIIQVSIYERITTAMCSGANENINEVKLDKKLSPINVWAIAFGCIIGSGAFLLPGTSFLPKAGPLGAAAAMLTGAFAMVIIAINYNFMINKYPVAGGELTYAKEAFGNIHSFICAWFLSLSYLMIVPFNATALSMVARSFFGSVFQVGFHYNAAGYDIYCGEIILGIFVLVFFALLNIRGVKFTGMFQTVLSCLLVSAVIIIFTAAVLKGVLNVENLSPLLAENDVLADAASKTTGALARHGRSGLSGVLKVLAVAPFCFLGFDTTSQAAEELKFSVKKSKIIMVLSIFFGAFIYIALNLAAASCRPDGYADWTEYIADVNAGALSGIENIPTFNAARTLLGTPGLIFIGIAVLAAICSGITGFYLATSRIMYRMSKAKIIPPWFGMLHPKYKTPAKTLLFILAISVIAPFFGRTALGWIVDMTSLGAAIGFGYTSAAAFKFARKDGNRSIAVTGFLGTAMSCVFALLLLVPVPMLDCALGRESLICLALWIVMGIVFYVYENFCHREKFMIK